MRMVIMTEISSLLRQAADKSLLEEAYKQTVKELADQTGAWAIDRDGDLYRVKCPVCRTPEVIHVDSGFFVCKKRHIFSAYTEDGVRQITEENIKRVIGEDLDDGMDAHGHGPYTAYDPKEKAPIYLTCWLHDQGNVTLQLISDKVWELRKLSKIADDLFLDYMIEVETMLGGEKRAELGTRIKTWPKYVNNMKWFLLVLELKKLFPGDFYWSVGIVEESDR